MTLETESLGLLQEALTRLEEASLATYFQLQFHK